MAQVWASAATIRACQTPARTEPPARSKKPRCSTANVSMVSLVSAPFDFNIFSLNTFSGYASVVSKKQIAVLFGANSGAEMTTFTFNYTLLNSKRFCSHSLLSSEYLDLTVLMKDSAGQRMLV